MGADRTGIDESAARQIDEYFAEARRVLGTLPTHRRVVAERFFDESGGMQLVLHALFGVRINRAWGLALRKRFCRGFGFELQAAATDEAIVLSLGPQNSFPLLSVFDFLHPGTAREVLTQALLATPMFETRWRWNATRSLRLERMRNGKRVPAPLLRMRANDLLAAAFPHVIACPENLPGGDLPVPMDHPMVRQTIEDCLHEAMDVDGFVQMLTDLREGRIERAAVDTPEPSPLARAILAAHPYAFLDDAPLEERRTQAVIGRRALDPSRADDIGALDRDAVMRVREEAWPRPENAEELHEALLWMGYLTPGDVAAGPLAWMEETGSARSSAAPQGPSLVVEGESESPTASGWSRWIAQLSADGRVALDAGRWIAVDASHEPKDLLRGRLEALGPVVDDDPRVRGAVFDAHGDFPAPARVGERASLPVPTPGDPAAASSELQRLLLELECEGSVLRTRLDGRQAWCERRLLARIHRYTIDRLRREIEPVSPAEFLHFLTRWQHAAGAQRLDGPEGVRQVARQLAGFEVPAALWESAVLPLRVREYRREWLDELTMSGELAWGRLWGGGASPIRSTPISLFPREQLSDWLEIAPPADARDLSGAARDVLEALERRGALFHQEIAAAAALLPGHLEMGLAELIARGLITCDSYGGLRQLIVPPSRRRHRVRPAGRWSLLRHEPFRLASAGPAGHCERSEASARVARHSERSEESGSAVETALGCPGRMLRIAQHDEEESAGLLARQLLLRTGVVFRRLLAREKLPVAWGALLRVYRRMELRGDVRGGRFVAGFSGEQFALPEAVELLRAVRRDEDRPRVVVHAADPLNYVGILTPEPRVSAATRARVSVG